MVILSPLTTLTESWDYSCSLKTDRPVGRLNCCCSSPAQSFLFPSLGDLLSYFSLSPLWVVRLFLLFKDWSAGRSFKLLLVLASTVIPGFESHRDPWPRFLFCPRHVRVLEVGSPLRRGEGSVFLCRSFVFCTVDNSVPNWLLNCCWPSPAKRLLVPKPTELMTTRYSLTYLEAFRLSPNLEDQVPVFMSPTDSVAHLYAHAPGLFFAFYDSQGYGGGILTRLHLWLKYILYTYLFSSYLSGKTSRPRYEDQQVNVE
jgi:hypothetical protein